MQNWKVDKLLSGETIVSREPGNSMTPIIKSKQPVRLAPTTWQETEVGDMVYCKVRGNLYTHLVKAKSDKKGCLIGNNHGRVNGWTKKVYGKVTKVYSSVEESKLDKTTAPKNNS
jgi:hypothetical protein